MLSYQILIVHDQREMRDKLRSVVEKMGPNFTVVTVPSGEEALLELRTRNFDVLVSDVTLPGITGLELLKKAKDRKPGLKVILILRVLSKTSRLRVDRAGADAVILKSADPADFLDKIERCLGMVESSRNLPERVVPKENLSERLASLHLAMDSIASFFLDDLGRIHAQAGHLPEVNFKESWVPVLMAAFSANGKVARILGSSPPGDLSYFSGAEFNIFLAHVGESYALIQVVRPGTQGNDLSKKIQTIAAGIGDLSRILKQIGIPVESTERPVIRNAEIEEIVADDEIPQLEKIFQGRDSHFPKAEEVDAFWNSILGGEVSDGIHNTDALTYDQALQLGLAPEEDDE